MRCSKLSTHRVSKITRTPVIFWHNFIKTASISVIFDIRNLHLVLNKFKTYKFCVCSKFLRPLPQQQLIANSYCSQKYKMFKTACVCSNNKWHHKLQHVSKCCFSLDTGLIRNHFPRLSVIFLVFPLNLRLFQILSPVENLCNNKTRSSADADKPARRV